MTAFLAPSRPNGNAPALAAAAPDAAIVLDEPSVAIAGRERVCVSDRYGVAVTLRSIATASPT